MAPELPSRSRRARSCLCGSTVRLPQLHRRLQLRCGRVQGAHFAHRARKFRFGLVERDLGVGLVQPHQRLAGLDELRVVGTDADHGAGDLRGDLHDVAADVGIVGALVKAQHLRPVHNVAEGSDQHRACKPAQEKPAAALRSGFLGDLRVHDSSSIPSSACRGE